MKILRIVLGYKTFSPLQPDSIVVFIKDVLFILRHSQLCGMVSAIMAAAQWLELEVM